LFSQMLKPANGLGGEFRDLELGMS
jgi:hypothetical protein